MKLRISNLNDYLEKEDYSIRENKKQIKNKKIKKMRKNQ